jgi:hypothetical protein
MGTLNFVGVGSSPTNPLDVIAVADIQAALNTGVTRSYVNARVGTLAAGKATKLYVDTQDSTFATPAYYEAQDAFNTPLTQIGAPIGVAPLVGGVIPAINVPVLGVGIIRGPYGFTASRAGSAGFSTPFNFADFPGGVLGVNCQLMCFMTVIVQASATAHPVIDVRYSTTGNTTFAGQIPISRGVGRTNFADSHTITVEPIAPAAGAGQNGVQVTIPASASLTINAWLYDGLNAGGLVSTQVGYVVSSALYLARTVL